ncbi:DNA polymerase IV [Rhodococcus sp. MALMAid1271]|uniref:DNA polymerase IV n=1 Tax=Rhodococcus sp. MALMAid1271 TaxID=3411744 RepID=UPI003B9E7FFC
MDAFFASAEQLTRPTLRGRPVLVGGAGGRGVVAGCSYQARAFGARSAMPMHQARRLVGASAVVLPPRFVLYSELSRRGFEALRVRMPVLEQLSIDEAFGEPLELAGATVGEVEEFCASLRALVLEETGLVASIGAGSGKQIAKIASGLAKPDGITVVPPGVQAELLADLPVRKLWGIGPVAGERLHRLGIDTIGKFVATPESEVASILGATMGPSLHQLARGIDNRVVAERAEAKQVSAETTFAQDVISLAQLRPAIESIVDSTYRRLLKDGRGARTVVLKLRKSDMSIITRSATLPYATVDKQTIVATAQRLAVDPVDVGPIRLVGVGLAGLSAVRQGSLFPELDYEPVADTTQESPASGRSAANETTGNEATASETTAREVTSSSVVPDSPRWQPGQDVRHSEFGHGWVQGAGHSVVTVRFETRTSGPGTARTFAEADENLVIADALDSLK